MLAPKTRLKFNWYVEKLKLSAENSENHIPYVYETTISDSAREIIDRIYTTYKENLPPYRDSVLPQEYRPECMDRGGDKYASHEHAMYLWNACAYMQGGTQSDFAFKSLTNIYESHPNLFNCDELAQAPTDEIIDILKKHGLGQQARVANAWTENARRLSANYDGDPRNIFQGVSSYQDCLDRICNDKKGGGFLGFQGKMTSMILYFYADESLIDSVNFPPPIDFHVLRVAFATEILKTDQREFHKNPETESILRQELLKYVNETGVNPIELTNAMWQLSSNFCNQNPGNKTYKDGGGKRTVENNQEFATKSQSEAFFRSCGKCAINTYCKYCIPSGPYYTRGIIQLKDKPKTQYTKQTSLF